MTKDYPKTVLIYMDESYDERCYVYAAIFIDVSQWNACFAYLQKWREEWMAKHGISTRMELHATDFVAGRGQPRTKHKRQRAFRTELFCEALGRIEAMPGVRIITAITKNKLECNMLFERMLNRINRTLEASNAYGILICDEGNEKQIITQVRRLKKKNPIPHTRDLGKSGSRDVPIDRIIEDPLFKSSHSSYFIQLADFVAYALLRCEHPTPTTLAKTRQAFDRLDKSLVKIAFARDPKKKGIIRW